MQTQFGVSNVWHGRFGRMAKESNSRSVGSKRKKKHSHYAKSKPNYLRLWKFRVLEIVHAETVLQFHRISFYFPNTVWRSPLSSSKFYRHFYIQTHLFDILCVNSLSWPSPSATPQSTRQGSFRAVAQELNANKRPNRKRCVCFNPVESAITDAYDRDNYTHLKRPKSHDIAMAARLSDTIDNIPLTVCGHVFMSFLVLSHFNRI